MATSFKDLRQEGDFTDVTLACEGNQQLQAHKLILSSSSPFFRNILRSYKSAEPLIYLRQVSYQDLASVVDFMYYGQADVQQENLNSFLALAEEFELKGLTRQQKTEDLSRTEQKRIKRRSVDQKEVNNKVYGHTSKDVEAKELEAKKKKILEGQFEYGQPKEPEVFRYPKMILMIQKK